MLKVENKNTKNNEDNSVVCKHCQSQNVRKYGFVDGVQNYFCNDCRRKFKADDRLFKMKTPHYSGIIRTG